MKTISRDEIKKNLDNNEQMVLVEALPEKSFTEGHLPGALNIPADKVEENASMLLPNKEELIVTYCTNTSCQASESAADTLEDLGYTNVARYVEGKEDWKQAGFPLDKSGAGAGAGA